ncbi:hypothetical protein [Paractinoplanes brasiliensis]|uniref:Uncharacterized protein n=1 Tax=Paractinoplanes brasiliensis TaxID=52695 RepID=A0A4R6K1U9_9ACTN|nr:hypothetical protein [Actinoplanes brasiliensis]TDO42101.1 hypothetical protein C8E87_5864 [Actinoplanes brasiliensis]GID32036.1 hypothetical protein Abr02nite_70190 [Actinoplanes brasiliensis]
MSAQPDSFSHPGPRTAGVLIWAVYFVALAATYVVAGRRGDTSGQQAAAWGLSIAVALAVIGLPVLTASWAQADPAALRLGYGLCLLGTALLIAVAMSLTLARQPIGAWLLLPPLAAGPLLAVSLHRGPRRRRWRWVKPARTGSPALLRPGWEDRLGQAELAVALDEGFWAEARRNLNPRAYEQGGVALLVRTPGTLLVFGAVFPAQRHANAVACEFPSAEVDRVRHAINAVAPAIGVRGDTIVVTWVHTHPRLGVFLSGTDHATSQRWRALDPNFTPIVIDISQAALSEAIGVFNGEGRKILPMNTATGLVGRNALARLRTALDGAYADAGAEPPLILLGDAAPKGALSRATRR